MPAGAADRRKTASAFIDAFNRADWDALRDLVAGDAVYVESGTGGSVEGIDAYFAVLRAWRAAFPDVAGTIGSAVAQGDVVAQELRWERTHTGDLQTEDGAVAATGAHISVGAASFLRYDGDRIGEIHHHLDLLTLLRQIGAAPA